MAKEEDNINRPSHRSFLALHAILWSILGLFAYFLLNLPFYIYVFFGLSYLIYKTKVQNTEIVSSVFIREAENINVIVVGSGFSGLTMGIKLKEAGIPFRILEKSSNIGGTWDANRYTLFENCSKCRIRILAFSNNFCPI